jgi:glutamyl-Q tRNA(Asp) synthetase
VTALASYADARSHGGRWLLRIEDIDPPRCMPGAADDILRTLERVGLEWDGDVMYQSRRTSAYQEALERLNRGGVIFPCACTRKEQGDGPYDGACRQGIPNGKPIRSWRVRVPDGAVHVVDRLHGALSEDVSRTVGDFVLLRADGVYSYQLAVVLDDAFSGVSDVVRGADLLSSAARQVSLHRLLGLTPPRYAHVPVVAGEDGEKLSKQTLAPAVATDSGALWNAAAFLGHTPPREFRGAPPRELLAWVVKTWDLAKVPQLKIATHSFD